VASRPGSDVTRRLTVQELVTQVVVPTRTANAAVEVARVQGLTAAELIERLVGQEAARLTEESEGLLDPGTPPVTGRSATSSPARLEKVAGYVSQSKGA